ncbi:MAG: polymer-forming cytoskeletal protein [Aquificaceae bacterium]
MFGKKEEAKVSRQEIRNLIGAGCVFEGNLTISEGLTRIDGEVLGNISGSGGVLIGEKGKVKGNISLSEVVIYGKVEGDISAKSVELRSGSNVKGNITTAELLIEKGAIYNGQCKVEQSSTEAP